MTPVLWVLSQERVLQKVGVGGVGWGVSLAGHRSRFLCVE